MTRKWFASAILLISACGEPLASDAADARRDRYALFFSKPSLRANFT